MTAIPPIAPDAFEQEFWAWHARREAGWVEPHGFLAITGLHRLGDAAQPIPNLPGKWRAGASGFEVELGAHEALLVDGEAVSGVYRSGPIEERASRFVMAGGIKIELGVRGGHYIVRPRDPARLQSHAYAGTPVFAPLPEWVVSGRFWPEPEGRRANIRSAIAGIDYIYDVPGTVTFSLNGKAHSLLLLEGRGPGLYTALFRDRTSGTSTFALSRSLSVAVEDDGTAMLDFNRAGNLPCAHSPYATCPLAPEENWLDIAIEAGEMMPFAARKRTASGQAAAEWGRLLPL